VGADTDPVKANEFVTNVTESPVEVIAFGISNDAALIDIGPAIDQSRWILMLAVLSPVRPITSPPKLLESVIPAVLFWKFENAELPSAGKKLAVPVEETVVPRFPVPPWVIRLPTTSTSAEDEVTRLFEQVLTGQEPSLTAPCEFPENS
jgi:hypothetical protein